MTDFLVKAPIRKATESNGSVHMYGWAAMSRDDLGEPVIDSDDEYIPIAELEKAAQRAFLRRGGAGAVGVQHDEFSKADLVESFVLSAEKREAFGLGAGPQGWMVGLRSTDPEVIKAVRSGELLELSIRGKARKEQVAYTEGSASDVLKKDSVANRSQTQKTVGVMRDLELADVELLSIVDRGASANERVRSRIVLVKRQTLEGQMPNVKKARTPSAILAELFESGALSDLSPEDKEALLTAMGGAAPAPEAPDGTPAEGASAEPVMGEEQEEKTEDEETPKAEDEETEQMKRDKAALEKRNQALEARLMKLEKDAARSEVREMVKRDMSFFPGASVDELVDVIQEVNQNLGEDMAKRAVSMLKAASEVCKGSDLFKTAGVRKGEGSGSPNDELMAIAKSMREKDPKLSRHESIVLAGRERPDLWAKRNER